MSATHPPRRAAIYQQGDFAGILKESGPDAWHFTYDADYTGLPISLNLQVRPEPYPFDGFPPLFDGLLPEGLQLEALLRSRKIDRGDAFSQLLAVGGDLVGSLTVEVMTTDGKDEQTTS